jgi:hypothetical protein
MQRDIAVDPEIELHLRGRGMFHHPMFQFFCLHCLSPCSYIIEHVFFSFKGDLGIMMEKREGNNLLAGQEERLHSAGRVVT